MEQTVYIDVFFLINFSMDFLGLFLAAKLLSRRESLLRLFLAALFGGFYACIALIFPLDDTLLAFSFAVDALACFLMALIAVFHRRAIRGVFSFSLVFGAISILLGGAMTALFYAFNRLGLDRAFGGGDAESDGISVWLFAIFAAISGFVALIGGKFFKKKASRSSGSLEILYGKRKIKLPCMCDSGNLLREPISQLPCILVELDSVKEIFPRSLYDCVKTGNIEGLPSSEAARIRMIPACDASGEVMLLGIRPDGIMLDMGKGATSVCAYIAFSREKISAQGAKALVPSELAFGTA